MVFDEAEEFLGDAGEMCFVAFLVVIGDDDFPSPAFFLEGDTGIFCLEGGELRCQRLFVSGVGTDGFDIEGRLVVLCCILQNDEVGLCAAHPGGVGVTGAGRGIVGPGGGGFHANLFEMVVDLAVGIDL